MTLNASLRETPFSLQIIVAALGAAVAVPIIYTIINGPALRAEAERERVEQIDQENAIFCEKFGMMRGTSAFSTCANDLEGIRKRHEERIYQDLAGIL